MAALQLQSRFAGLKIEDDEASSNQKGKKKTSPAQSNVPKKSEVAKKKNGATKSQQNVSQKKKKPKANPASSEQWEQWKQKDEAMVDGNYEDELEQAILLSKLDFEEKKKLFKQKDGETEKKTEPGAKANKKQKKKNVMSLEQFNDMVSGEDHKDAKAQGDEKEIEKDTEFFERIKDETRNEIIKEKIQDGLRTRLSQSDELITRVQFADALDKKIKEIHSLKKEVKRLKDELLAVKSRNTKLCKILGQAEMKDKAEILEEVERLREVQTELTSEVESLHTDLEKERSKNPEHKANIKKKKGGSAEKEK